MKFKIKQYHNPVQTIDWVKDNIFVNHDDGKNKLNGNEAVVFHVYPIQNNVLHEDKLAGIITCIVPKDKDNGNINLYDIAVNPEFENQISKVEILDEFFNNAEKYLKRKPTSFYSIIGNLLSDIPDVLEKYDFASKIDEYPFVTFSLPYNKIKSNINKRINQDQKEKQ